MPVALTIRKPLEADVVTRDERIDRRPVCAHEGREDAVLPPCSRVTASGRAAPCRPPFGRVGYGQLPTRGFMSANIPLGFGYQIQACRT